MNNHASSTPAPKHGPMPARPEPDTVRFSRNPAKRMQIKRIVRRYFALLKANGIKPKRTPMDYEMDLAAVVGSGQKFSLDTLERFDDFNLAHDIDGIAYHLNRSTGKLDMALFLPRASRQSYIDAMKE